ncbi:hypothetical protein SADUNF_Sadunf10G0187800 [Salix dunnii]|uniref:Uncharacterized protein n=1 Tax=Salix dunnii TaxID=1413687 RepID=A0A835JTX0_9ROSI|nr:hypothetical protein SADUNF_Sadunf10G0187800 [Salix dunnii]
MWISLGFIFDVLGFVLEDRSLGLWDLLEPFQFCRLRCIYLNNLLEEMSKLVNKAETDFDLHDL